MSCLILSGFARFVFIRLREQRAADQFADRENRSKEIGTALTLYVQDSDGWLPPPYNWQDPISRKQYFPDGNYAACFSGYPTHYALNSYLAGKNVNRIFDGRRDNFDYEVTTVRFTKRPAPPETTWAPGKIFSSRQTRTGASSGSAMVTPCRLWDQLATMVTWSDGLFRRSKFWGPVNRPDQLPPPISHHARRIPPHPPPFGSLDRAALQPARKFALRQ